MRRKTPTTKFATHSGKVIPLAMAGLLMLGTLWVRELGQ